jgi:GNAT superfamily N-acetyltransferase
MVGSTESEREWTIRNYREGDEEQILELRGVALSGPKNKQWWKWMYRDGPLGPATIALAEVKHRIIGHMASVPVPIKIKDQVTRGGHGVDLMVHPDYRRQGIFVALTKAMVEYSKGIDSKGIDKSIGYGVPSDQSRPGMVNRFHVKEIF